MTSRFIVALLTLVFVQVIQGCSSPPSEEELVARATAALANNQVPAAELDVKTALQANPNNPAARSLYGQIYLRQMNPSVAVGEFEKAVAAADSPESRLLLAKALVLSGDSAKLISDAESNDYLALAEDPEFKAVLARAYLGQNQYEEAREALETVAVEGNDYVDITRAVFALQLEKNGDLAKDLLKAVVARNPENADAWSVLGNLAVMDQDNLGASEYFTKAAAVNPYRLQDRLQLVTAKIRLGKTDEASADLTGLEAVIPNFPEVNFLRGQLAFDAGEYEDALDAFSRALTVNPNHAGALLLAGNSNAREGNLATAQRQYTRFLSQRPGHLGASLQLANVWLLQSQPEKAEAVARDILKEYDMNASALTLLAMALSAQGMHAESAQTYAEVASLQPDSTESRVALGSQQMVAGDTAAGIAQLEAAVELDPGNATARERLIEAYLSVQDLDAAARAAEAYSNAAGESARAAIYLGRVRLQQEDTDGARSLFEKALELDPGNVTANGGLAALAVLGKDIDGAQAALENALESSPGELRSSMNLAAILEQSGDRDEMESVLTAALEANPAAAEPRIALARLALTRNKPGEAIGFLTPIEDSSTDNARVQEVLTTAYLRSEQIGAATDSARKLLKLQGENPAALALVARVESAAGRHEVAEGHLQKALQARPDSVDLRKMLIESLIQQRELEQVREQVALLPEDVQDEPAVLVVRGRLAIAENDLASAKGFFAQAFGAQRNNLNLALLAGVQWGLGEREETMRLLSDWLEEYPDDVLSRNTLASHYLEMGNEDASREQYEMIVARQPENAMALNNLAWLYRETDKDAALGYIERADKLAPQSAQVKDTYSMIELARGNVKRAMSLNDKALESAPGNPDIRYSRAQIMLGAGQQSEAKALLRELAAAPAFASQPAVKKLLSTL